MKCVDNGYILIRKSFRVIITIMYDHIGCHPDALFEVHPTLLWEKAGHKGRQVQTELRGAIFTPSGPLSKSSYSILYAMKTSH